ncbi:MAG: hypothetical protein NVSMB25_13700 [Thermoleophilaceae bacterium]
MRSTLVCGNDGVERDLAGMVDDRLSRPLGVAQAEHEGAIVHSARERLTVLACHHDIHSKLRRSGEEVGSPVGIGGKDQEDARHAYRVRARSFGHCFRADPPDQAVRRPGARLVARTAAAAQSAPPGRAWPAKRNGTGCQGLPWSLYRR